MSQITLSLVPRYIAAFGQVAISKALAKTAVVDKDYGFKLYPENPNKEFEDIKFKTDSEEIRFGAIPFVGDAQGAENRSDFLFYQNVIAPPPLIHFEQEKNIIETEINGTDNVVVERWGTKPWTMRFRGVLVDMENHFYPEDKVKALRKLFQYNGIVDCTGTQFIDKKIKSLYFKRITINGVEGFQDTIQYTIEARSIKPVGFNLLNPNS